MRTAYTIEVDGELYRTARRVHPADLKWVETMLRRGYTCREIDDWRLVPNRITRAVYRKMKAEKRLPDCACGLPASHRGYCWARREEAS